MPAGKLHAADKVRKADGLYGVVRSVVLVPRLQVMYNLTVAGAHTYFVGDGQWLVHNCPTPKLPSGVRVLQTGGTKLEKYTLNELKKIGIDPHEAQRGLENLKKLRGLPKDFHFSKILSNGDVLDDLGQVIGNIRDYVQ